MRATGDVLIIGGGIVGCACAYELAKAGARVTVLEYGKANMQATNAAAGMLAPLGESAEPGAMMRFGLRALEAYPATVRELEAACGFELEFRPDGILKIAFDEDEAAALRRRFAWQRELDLDVAWLDGDTCRELEPKLSPRVLCGIFSPREAWINNQYIAMALERGAQARGAVFHARAPVTRVRRAGGRVTAVEAGGGWFEADTVVLAAGARSGQIAAKMGLHVPVHPVRGQMVALGGMRQPIRHVVWSHTGYLVPRNNGLTFAGATVERVGFRRRTTKAGVASLRAMAARAVPQLGAATLAFEWAGLRPGTPDDLPIIGPLEDSNVMVATGHFRNGILLGPLTGALIAAGIMQSDWSGVPVEFSPRRFAR